jgi:tRNA(Ile2) C34 agmatinyltransferase TiaS
MERKNADTFKICQARYDNMQHPDYYREDPPPCHICGDDADSDGSEGPICDDCKAESYEETEYMEARQK